MKKRTKIILIVILMLIIAPFAGLYIMSKVHHHNVHNEFVAFLNHEFGDNIAFSDLEFSYINNFPYAQILLKNVVISDDTVILSTIGTIDISVNPFKLLKKQVELKKLLIADVNFRSVIDSLGNKPKLLAGKSKSDDSVHEAMLINAENIRLKNCHVYFANEVKGNQTGVYIESARLQLHSADSMLMITGEFDGNLDSLVSNHNVLFYDQPVLAREVEFNINRITKKKEVVGGYAMAQSLKLYPRLSMQPFEDGNLVELHIFGEDSFDVFLNLFEFHLDFDLNQTAPEAKLSLSYNQKGFVNPFQRPYSELDFSIQNAVFEGEDLPFPIEVAEITGNYNNGEKHSPETVELQIDTINTRINESFLNGRFKLQNLRDPYVDAHLMAELNMEHLIPKSGNIKLTGIIDLDLAINGKISEIRQFHLENKQKAFGKIEVHNLAVVLNDEGYAIELLNGNTILNNHILEITALVGTFNKSAFHFAGSLENLDRFVVPREENVIGDFSLHFDELDLTKIDFGDQEKKKQGNSGFPAFADLSLGVKLTGNKLITQFGDFTNLLLDCKLKQNELKIDKVNFEYKDGKFKGNGNVAFNKTGIQKADIQNMTIDFIDGHSVIKGEADFANNQVKSAVLLADLNFKTFDFTEFESLFAPKDKKKETKTPFVFPDKLNIDINMMAAELKYKDAVLKNTKLNIIANEKSAKLNTFQTMLPFGKLDASGLIDDYSSDEPYFAGNLNLELDTVDINNIMAMQVLGLPNIEGKSQQPKEKMISELPGNVNFKLNVNANQVYYQNIQISDLSMLLNYQPDAVRLRNLSFNIGDGAVKVNGQIDYSKGVKTTGYLYSNAHDLNINKILQSFDDFNQDVFTHDNTSGHIAWTSHYYFSLDSTLTPISNEDTWIINAHIQEAEFDSVAPIQNTLFFVGHKAKDNMLVSDLNMSALLFQNKLFIRDVFMNDNIANLGFFGEIDMEEKDMNFNIEVSLSDLFFRSKKKRSVQTTEGEIDLDNDSKLFLKMVGPFKDSKISIQKKHDFEKSREDLDNVIRSAANYFKQKQELQ
ncbi:MAG TPA: AsmA family protein [Bacteroidales bacterium]|nr:AsmA family protein [Bacteroidales bacterium]HRX96708.1 AsmA family protein [Bacteroidales bacterium]